MVVNYVNFLFTYFHYALGVYMNKIFNKINSFSLSFLTFVFLIIFSTQQAKADCFVDGVQFDIGGRTGSGVTAANVSLSRSF